MSSMYINMTHSITLLLFVLLVTQVISVERISVPHDIHPGFSIKQLHSKGRSLSLIQNDASPYFTLLDDGCLISTAKLSHLANSSLNISIEEEQDGFKVIKPLTIHIRDRNQMIKFPKASFLGNINENEPPNTAVEGLNNLHVLNSVGNVTYMLSDSHNFGVLQKRDVVSIFSKRSLDKEVKNVYLLNLNATDSEGCSVSTRIKIIVNDVNDNPPVFVKKYYNWKLKPNFPVYSTVGIVKAIDADGDKPVFKFVKSNSSRAFVVVPKTGEVILMYPPELGFHSYYIIASDDRDKPMYSDMIPVSIIVSEETENKVLQRRKRSVRQTRTYEHFLESDASIPGKVMFRLESVHPDEIFSLENQSRWIDIDHNGDVKVREPWDYEQLEREKTIDFWVQIRAPHQPEPDRQRIIIHVQDSNDENPYFINRPMPMQAVVQLNAPPGTQVFKLQARDPDLESKIHYYLVRDRSK